MTPIRDASGRFARKPLADLSASYRTRIERARSRGRTLAEARGHGSTSVKVGATEALFGSESYEKSLRVLSRMRQGESLTAAARDEDISPETVRRHAGTALQREGRGRYRVTHTDRLYRSMQHLTEGGYVWVEPANSGEATKLSRYHHAINRYLHFGDDRPLRRFRRMRFRIRGGDSLGFVTDLEVIDRLADAGVLQFPSIYRQTA